MFFWKFLYLLSISYYLSVFVNVVKNNYHGRKFSELKFQKNWNLNMHCFVIFDAEVNGIYRSFANTMSPLGWLTVKPWSDR